MEIYQKAFDIIERYFGTEEEDKDVSKYLEKKYAFNKCLQFTSKGKSSFMKILTIGEQL